MVAMFNFITNSKRGSYALGRFGDGGNEKEGARTKS
jgi:hypothetical protein